MNTGISAVYRFLIDACLIMMVIYFLNVDVGREINVSSLVISTIVLALIYFILKQLLNGRMLLFHFVLLGVISFMMNAWLGLLLFHATIIAIFLTWRLALYYFKPDTNQEKGILITSVLLGFFLYLPAIFLENPDAHTGLYFILVQFTILIGGKISTRMMNVEEHNHSGKAKQLSYIFGVPSGILLITAGLFWFTPFMIKGFYSLFSWIAYQIGLGATPLFEWFNRQQAEIETTPNGEQENISQEEQNVLEQAREQTETISAETIMYIIIGACIISAIGIYYRHRNRLIRKKSKTADEEKMQMETEKLSFRFSDLKENLKRKAPKSEIRKAFFELERWAAKRKLGRYDDETVEQWLHRLQLDTNRYADVIDFYQTVRYGEQHLTEDEKRQYTDQLIELKNTLKQKLT
ncbi:MULTISPECIES: DUF4129 domain-containing protein [Allobacillus]|uniref:DUF4129 domain-containing protein n=1 Tax=Allobacillus salarius TaxID=1955272 RepID=A0A556PNQ2_9BACI|nr:DUF4129 domain-containing protein [Allobacillus salarius]TSJ66020.1 DUF4129 domain-containing protein [Allobacillus salarius]